MQTGKIRIFTGLMMLFIAAAALNFAAPAFAGPAFTGNAAADFTAADVIVISDPGGIGDVGVPSQAPAGTVSGWDMSAVYFDYDPITDIMYVGIDCGGPAHPNVICGDVDADGDPNTTSSWLNSVSGTDLPNFSGSEAISLLIDTNNDNNADVTVGIFDDGDISAFGVFNRAFPAGFVSPQSSFFRGAALSNTVTHTTPSAAQPDFEFSIAAFSTLTGFSFTPGDAFTFKAMVFMGSQDDDGIGEDFVPGTTGTAVNMPAAPSLGNFVWEDANGNGVQDAGETGISGVTVKLLDSAGNPVPGAGGAPITAVTDASGNYKFIAPNPGDYQAEFTPPVGYVFSPKDQGADDAKDSDADTATGKTAVTTLASAESDMTWDAGLYRPASLGNFVWLDANRNGIQDAGETGVSGLTVSLLDGTGNPVTDGSGNPVTAVTDASGNYTFSNLRPGDYTVGFAAPAGYAFTLKDQGADDALDSDADATTGRTVSTAPVSGENDLTWDAGIFQLASLGNFVWEDLNADGVQDAGEPGISGVIVNLLDSTGNSVNDAGGAPVTETTDAAGNYTFANLIPGDYRVGFAAPAGYVVSPQDQGADDALDSDADTATSQTASTTLVSGENDLTWDAGFYRRASVGNFVWNDLNANGIQDAGETGVAGVTVNLLDGSGNPVNDAGGTPLTATTDAAGKYTFTNLVPGNYMISFAAPAGYSISAKDQGADDALDSDADTATGKTVSTTLVSGENDLTWDMGIYQRASLGNFVWEDLNNNGIQDAGELGVPGVTVNLYNAAGTSAGTTATDASGNYSFGNLVPGNYSVEFVPPAGYTLSPKDQGADDAKDSDADPATGRTVATTLISGENDLTWDAGIFRAASLGNFVWTDTNGNGVQDAGETGIPGVTVNLYNSAGTLVKTAVTDASGNYTFGGLASGDYTVEFVPPAGFQISPKDQGADDALDSDADPTTHRTAATTLTPGENDLTWDAGLYQPASLGNFVWNDANANGVQDAGETGVQGVTVNLYNAAGTSAGTTVTDAGGNYSFANLIPGDYSLEFALPAGYVVSPKDQGADDTKDSDADPTTHRTVATTLVSGENDPGWDAGIYQPASLGNFVWTDTNGNGIQDAGETGVQGVTVNLYNAAGTSAGTTVTDAGGNYSFANLVPGSYSVEFVPPAGYTLSPPNIKTDQGADDALDSDADAATHRTALIALTSGQNNPNADAGLYLPASLGNFVWEDTNSNGIQDAGEPPVAGVTVTLYDSAGNAAGNTVTDAGGNYAFTNLAPGDYAVEFAPPAGYALTLQDQGADDAADSDANPGTRRTVTTNLTSGENDLTWDAGLYRTTSFGDHVWDDLNGNGIQDAGEPGIAAVTVTLYDGAGASKGTKVTDANGNYSFTDLNPGDYFVEITPPAGFQVSPKDQGADDAADSDIDPATHQSAPTTLSSGENDLTWDAGLYRLASLGDYVWEDTNADGIQNAGEGGIAGVTVTLYDGAGTSKGTATTDAAGNYGFANLVPGDYDVEFVLPAGFQISPKDQGTDDTKDSDADIATRRTAVTTLTSGENDPTWDAGIYRAASLGNMVWNDTNANGIQDAGEPGIAGVTLTLFDSADTAKGTATTDAAGNYSFANLVPGDYYVEFALPAGYSVSPKDQGGDDTKDSDADVTTRRTVVTTLISGENDTGWDFGVYTLASIGDYVWNDTNINGIQDAGEPPVSGVTVNLYNSAGVSKDSTVTDASGKYAFSALVPGDYSVGFVLPAGYSISPKDQGSNDAADSDADPATGRTAVTTLSPGENDPTWDAGIYVPKNEVKAVQQDTLSKDADNNGKPSPGDTLTYQIVITNSGNTPLTGVKFSDTPDANTTLVPGSVKTGQGSVTSGSNPGDTTVSVNIGTIPPGGSVTVSFDVVINSALPAGVSTVKNQGTVSSNELLPATTDDPDVGGTGDPTTTEITPRVEILSLKSVTDENGGNLRPGDVLRYSVVIKNTSGADGRGLVFTDDMPEYTGYVAGSVSAPAGSLVESESPTLRISGINVPARGQISLSFRVKLDDTLPAGADQIANQGTVGFDPEGDGTNNAAQKTDGDTVAPGEQPTVAPITAGPNFSDTDKSVSIQHDEGSDGVVSPGDMLRYKIKIPNTGNQDAVGVEFADPIPQNTVYVAGSVTASSGTAGYNAVANRIEWKGDAAAGSSVTLFFDVTVNTGILPGTLLSNQGTVSYDSDGDGTNNASEPTDGNTGEPGNLPTNVTVGGMPKGVASKSVKDVNGGNAEPGDELLYTIKMQNQSGFDVKGMEFVDTVPAHTTLVPGSIIAPSGAKIAEGTDVIRITGLDVPANGNITLSFRVKIADPLPLGVREIGNTGTINFDTNGDGINDGVQSTDGDTSAPGEQPTLIPIIAGPNFSETTKDFALKIDADNNAVGNAGDTLSYKIIIRNTGNQDAKNVEFTDPIPANTAYVSASVKADAGAASFNSAANRIEWKGDVAAGKSVTLVFDVKIADRMPMETLISNQGIVKYDSNGDGVNDASEPTDSDVSAPGNQPTDVITSGMVCVAMKTVRDLNGGNAEPGDELLYTVTLTNKSEREGNNTELVDSIPANTDYVAGSLSVPAGATVLSERPQIHIKGLTVPAKGQATISFRVRIADPLPPGVTEIANQASMTYYHQKPGVNYRVWETDGDLTQSGQNPTVIPVTAGPNFAETSKRVSLLNDLAKDGVLSPGDTLRYTVEIANTGNRDALGVEFEDSIPADTVYVNGSVTADSGTAVFNADADRIEWKGDVPANESVTVSFDVTVNAGIVPGTLISNQGTVRFDSNDDGVNDSSELTDADTAIPGNQPADIKVGGMPSGLAVKTVADADGGETVPGDELIYTITMRNQSSFDVKGIEFVDSLPAYTSLIPGSTELPPGSQLVTATSILRIRGIDVAANSETVIVFRVRIADSLPSGITEISNIGTVSFDTDGDGVNDGRQSTDGDLSKPGEQPTVIPVMIPLSEIFGTVFNDANSNGIQNLFSAGRETGIAGVTLVLSDSSGAEIGRTVTDAQGDYVFPDLKPGIYTVTETDPQGYISTTRNAVNVTAPPGDAGIADFGDIETGGISGTVFNDTNADTHQDSGDKGIANVVIELTDSAGNVITAVTDSNGGFVFRNLEPGVYEVRETDPDGFVSTTDNTVSVTLSAGGAASVNFGDHQGNSISGTVFEDTDGNGILDPFEYGMFDAEIRLFDSDGNLAATARTDTDGNYSFDNLAPGDYTVEKTDPPGFAVTTPDQVSVTLTPGGAAGVDFGDREAGSISGKVFNDINGDGHQNPGDAGLNHVTVTLLDENGSVAARTVTDENGSYSFNDMPPGAYTVQESNPAGFVSTTSDSVNVVLTAGGAAGANFGDRERNSISGTVFNDISGDGIQDAYEKGIFNVKIELTDSTGAVIATAFTDANGGYSFNNLAPGGLFSAWTVAETDPAGFGSTTPNTVSVTLEPGKSATADFGDRVYFSFGVSISGTVFNDINADTRRGPGEKGLFGVTVQLTDSDGSVIATTKTAADGSYLFDNLAPGNYIVRETDPAGSDFSWGSTTANKVSVNLPEGGSASVNFGDHQSGAVSGMVFYDINGDTVQNPDEGGLGGVVIELSLLDDTGNVIATAKTDANGLYIFPGLLPGDYRVLENDPAGYTSTTENTVTVSLKPGSAGFANFGDQPENSISGTVFRDADADGHAGPGDTGIADVTISLTDSEGRTVAETVTDGSGNYSFSGVAPGTYTVLETDPPGFVSTTANAVSVVLAAGGSAYANFGDHIYFSFGGSITGVVFNDFNGDMHRDTGDAGLGNVALALTDISGNVIAETLTSANGVYGFFNVMPGTYFVRETDPPGFGSTTPNSVKVTVPPSGIGTANFGDHESSSISGTVFNDYNADGIQDRDESGIFDVTVTLVLSDVDGNIVDEITTDANGNYIFQNLKPGVYTVKEADPSGFVSTTDNSVTVTLAPGASGVANFGDHTAGSITGAVFDDANADMHRDPGEAGLGKVVITLSDAQGNVIAGTATNANGVYNFSRLTPGQYTVSETDPAGWGSTTDNSVSVTVPPGRFAVADFGDRKGGVIAGIVFNDVNGDAVQNPDEPGLYNVTVGLADADGSLQAVTTTDANGNYVFPNVIPGDYIVRITNPEGFVVTGSASIPVSVSADAGASADFGNHETASISGVVFNDVNGDQHRDPGDAGLAGVTVEITDDGGSGLAITLTDAHGHYIFDNLPPGTYTIREYDPPGWGSTTPEAVSVSVPEGGFGVANFGDQKAGSISGMIFNDVNSDGVQNPTETGRSNVAVELLDENGNVADTVLTDVFGNYTFTGLVPGAYTVRATGLPGFTDTTPAEVATVLEPEGSVSVSFGIREESPEPETARITGTVFNDADRSGIQNAGESGIGNVRIELLDAGGNVIATTTTAADGTYSFENIEPGTYTVRESDTPSFESTTANAVSVNVPAGGTGVANFGDSEPVVVETARITGLVFDDANSNGIQDGGESGIGNVRIELTAGGNVIAVTATAGNGAYSFYNVTPGVYTVRETDADAFASTTTNAVSVAVPAGGVGIANFGDRRTVIVETARITGIVFEDANGNAVQDTGEQGLSDVTVELLDGSGSVIRRTMTDENGVYNFADLTPGIYTVREADPDGFTSTSPNALQTVAPAGGVGIANFGDQAEASETARIEGTVFDDVNGNAVQDEDEAGLSQVRLELLGSDGALISTTASDENGDYRFENIPPGTYTVRETDPDDFDSTTANTAQVTVPAGGTGIADFGDRETAVPVSGSIRGVVFNDANSSGVRDSGEEGIAGVTVELRDENGTVIRTAITGCDGTYLFTDIAEGRYSVREADPSGFVSTTENTVSVTVPTGGSAVADFGDWQSCIRIRLNAEKTATDLNAGRPEPGDIIAYQIDITNLGPGTALNLVFSDSIPLHTQMVAGSVTTTAGTITRETPVIVAIGSLPAGDSVQIAFRVTIDGNTPDGTLIMNQGLVTGDGGIEVFTDDPVSTAFYDPTMLIVGLSEFGYESPAAYKTVSGNLPVVEWRMRWVNENNADAVLVHIEDPVPADAAYIEGSLGADYGVYEYDKASNKIVWEGKISGDGGYVNIWYETSVPDDTERLENQACAVWDQDGDGDWKDEASVGLTHICTDDPNTMTWGDPTVWTAPGAGEPDCPDCLLPMKPF